ncbi:alpha/beta hydrolase [Paraburkholderia sp.]|uniref:alpha/beta hydrolase n=1 Tax=Paraburkholderia sp. TaxID=1926495 RepID=UPI003C7D85D0
MTHLAPLDAQLQAILEGLARRNAPRLFANPIAELRQAPPPGLSPVAVGGVRDAIATAQGLTVPVRIYWPDSEGPHVTVVFFHGGGFVLGSVERYDDAARRLCRALDGVVVSVGYRLAPEHPFPAAYEDGLAATLWALENSANLGGGAVTVAGESAGGNIAACVAIMARDLGLQLAGQLLIVPGTDMTRELSDTHDNPILTAADLVDSKRYFMGERMAEVSSFPPSPLLAPDHRSVAPAVIAVAGHDPLREEGVAYARKLQAAGVEVVLLQFDTMFHPFLGFASVATGPERAVQEICAAFKATIPI